MPFADKEKQKEYVRKWSREYQQRKKIEAEEKEKELKKAEHTANLLLKHLKLSDSDQKEVKALIDAEKFVEARRLIFFFNNRQREKNQFDLQQKKRELIDKYLGSDPAYQNMTQEGQHYWDLILSKHLDLLATVITQGQYLVKDDDADYYQKLKINAEETRDQIGLDMLNDLTQFFADKTKSNSVNLKHAPKFNMPKIIIENDKKEDTSTG